MAQWCQRSSPTNVARVQIPASAPYVGWVCCWFSPLLREVFLRVLRFSLSSKTNISKFQFDQDSGRRRTTLWMWYLQIIIIIILLLYLKKRTTNSTGIRENWINCLLYKVLLYLHIFLVLNKNCTEPYLVRYVEALYIYTQIKIVPFWSVNPSKNSPHWSNINMQKVFRRRYAVFNSTCK